MQELTITHAGSAPALDVPTEDGRAATPGRATPWLDRPWVGVGLGLAGLLALGLCWDLSIRVGLLPEQDIPRPTQVIGSLIDQLGTSEFWSAVRSTLTSAGVGLLIAVAIGLVGGVAMGSNEVIRRAFRPLVEFLRPVPGIMLVPMAIVMWGPTTRSSVFLVAFGCTWPMLVQIMAGVASVDDTALMTARSFGLSPFARARWLTVPNAMPYVMTGLRICTGIALIISVSAELIIGTPGIGSQIHQAHNVLDLEKMYALVVAAGLLGIAVTLVVGGMERYFLRWHPSRSSSAT